AHCPAECAARLRRRLLRPGSPADPLGASGPAAALLRPARPGRQARPGSGGSLGRGRAGGCGDEQVEQLPAEEREVFDLLWYAEMTQAAAAQVLGVAEITVRRRWLAARRRLGAALRHLPGQQ